MSEFKTRIGKVLFGCFEPEIRDSKQGKIKPVHDIQGNQIPFDSTRDGLVYDSNLDEDVLFIVPEDQKD